MTFNWGDISFEKMVKSGEILSDVLNYSISLIEDGTSAEFLEKVIESYILDCGAVPSFKGFNGYKYSSCISINDEVVHGVPDKDKIVVSGDLVTIDVGVSYDGHCTDAARTVVVGCCTDVRKEKLIGAAHLALAAAIEAAIVGNYTGNIGFNIQRIAETAGYNVPVNLGGHGIGRHPHMPPFIPNYGRKLQGTVLLGGMYLAIEPILFDGSPSTVIGDDGWTCKSVAGILSAHLEDTVYVSETGPVVLTSKDGGSK